MQTNHTTIIQYILNSSTNGLPPSFEGNSWIFLSALFCTMFASLISFTQIYMISKEMGNIPDKINSPLNIYRIQLMLAYASIVTACGPDAVYLWTYGEVTAATTTTILNIDRICDSLFVIPFVIFTWLQIKCGPVLKFQLIQRAIPLGFKSSKTSVKINVLAGLIMLLMSIGVTLSK